MRSAVNRQETLVPMVASYRRRPGVPPTQLPDLIVVWARQSNLTRISLVFGAWFVEEFPDVLCRFDETIEATPFLAAVAAEMLAEPRPDAILERMDFIAVVE